MTDRTLNISAALREAQLQHLEAALASKSASVPGKRSQMRRKRSR